jgi:hypothetical protein
MRSSSAAIARLFFSIILSESILFFSNAEAQDWVPGEGELGADQSRFILSLNLAYSDVSGSELEKVDPSPGICAGAAMRVFSLVSACASVSRNSSSVEGQITQLLDQDVRLDGRSANVVADVTLLRVGAGARIDSVREEKWRYRPYALGEVLFAKTNVKLDRVDGAPPQVTDSYSEFYFGALGRVGVDVRFTPNWGVDVSGTYEILEFPAGTAMVASVGAGVAYRI